MSGCKEVDEDRSGYGYIGFVNARDRVHKDRIYRDRAHNDRAYNDRWHSIRIERAGIEPMV